MNGLLASLNELRHCAPLLIESLGALAQLMQECLNRSSYRLVHYHATNAMNMDKRQLDVMVDGCRAHVNVLLPHAVGCFNQIFPSSNLSVAKAAAPMKDLLLSSSSMAEFNAAGAAAEKPAEKAKR